MNKKKINCKHGLDKAQEIQARRIKDKIKCGDRETLLELQHLIKKWLLSEWKFFSFSMYLRSDDCTTNKVFYSALCRLEQAGNVYGNYLNLRVI